MNEENSDVKIAAGLHRDKDPGEQPAATSGADRSKRLRFWVNWVPSQSRSSRRNF